MDNKGIYAEALEKALTETKRICPDIKHSFLLSQDCTIVAEDKDIDKTMAQEIVISFQNILEKAKTIDGLESFLIEGENGKIYFSRTDELYLSMITSRNADIIKLMSTQRLIIPTILKLLRNLETVPTPTESPPTKSPPTKSPPTKSPPTKSPLTNKLVVESYHSSGFMTVFAGETVKVDREILQEWSNSLDGKSVGEVQIETPGRKIAIFKVKAIKDLKERNKGKIRIPEKACKNLEVKNGETVSVRPTKSGTATQNLTSVLNTILS